MNKPLMYFVSEDRFSHMILLEDFDFGYVYYLHARNSFADAGIIPDKHQAEEYLDSLDIDEFMEYADAISIDFYLHFFTGNQIARKDL